MQIPGSGPWFVYLLLCRDNTFYCGITTDLVRRMAEHNSAEKGARYTRGRRPVQLVYAEATASKAQATKREGRIKKMNRAQKTALIQATTAGYKSKPALKCHPRRNS